MELKRTREKNTMNYPEYLTHNNNNNNHNNDELYMKTILTMTITITTAIIKEFVEMSAGFIFKVIGLSIESKFYSPTLPNYDL